LWEDNPLDLELSTSVTCAVDPLRLEQVFVNLLDNAAKHSPPGAPIHVSLLSSSPNGWVELSVRDFGPGIPPEMREHIFERFFQASPTGSRAGLGLGLYLSRTIVELHGGNISAHYPPDGGVRFVVRLPACPVISPTSS
jgi:signal transduction histidine kinase